MVFSPVMIFISLGMMGAFHSLESDGMTYTIAGFGIAQTVFIAVGVFYEAIFREDKVQRYSKPRKFAYNLTWFPSLYLVRFYCLHLSSSPSYDSLEGWIAPVGREQCDTAIQRDSPYALRPLLLPLTSTMMCITFVMHEVSHENRHYACFARRA